jgi:hypothetical protein
MATAVGSEDPSPPQSKSAHLDAPCAEWATAGFRRHAINADAELRRRRPYEKIESLHSAESVSDTEQEQAHAASGQDQAGTARGSPRHAPKPTVFGGTHRRSRLERPGHTLLRQEDARTDRHPPAAQAVHRAFDTNLPACSRAGDRTRGRKLTARSGETAIKTRSEAKLQGRTCQAAMSGWAFACS